MFTLGINWKWHDPCAALVMDGQVLAMAEEERFTRQKHARNSYPVNAARYCLDLAGIHWRDLDVLTVGWDIPAVVHWTDNTRRELLCALFGDDAATSPLPVEFVQHHVAHAASAFYASGFDSAGVLVVDGSGERQSISIFRMDRQQHGPHLLRSWPTSYSIGAMYEAATTTLGFSTLECGKTMGLAPYSPGRHSEVFPLGDLLPGTSRPLAALQDNMAYVELLHRWEEYFGRTFTSITKDRDQLCDDQIATMLAASAQRTVEEVYRQLYTDAVCLSGEQNLCVAGGVALNSVANGRLPEPVFIPPWPHDAGVALGAAWIVTPPAHGRVEHSPYLGPEPGPVPSSAELASRNLVISDFTPPDVAQLLLAGGIGALATGRAEVGPRALGNRSIIALPRPTEMAKVVNSLKGREPWRPLAPAALPHYADRLWARQPARERYMVGNTATSGLGRELLPAATHMDGSTRPQVVDKSLAPALAGILAELEAGGLPPILINTSFNGPGEPIVNSAADALNCFSRQSLDFMVLGDALVTHRSSAREVRPYQVQPNHAFG
ncbi:carbamoyltransferase C-terminal domain-containing protein [Actinosynnema sp. ALI-1.44]|uniref:carbamoyltransferase C-terminal domain-containing protein n=1 Tax=Actinosynnema sp. ALI-1.44 TaxID=1933779 RepID=UPI0011784A2A|nr:carbamoyltransferase C-terminal domain-containing protein [Actinosynnema sp. ALI-1.44]